MRFNSLLFASLAFAASTFASPHPVNTPTPAPATSPPTTSPPTTSPPAKPATPQVDPNTSCALSAGPAFTKTKEGLDAYMVCIKFMIGSIINDDPTHSQLIKASKWQLGQVRAKAADAHKANDDDPKWIRQDYFAAKLAFLDFEVDVTEEILNQGLPKYPWLGKALNWAQAKWNDMKGWWNKVWGSGAKGGKPGVPKKSATTAAAPSEKEAKQGNELLKMLSEKMEKAENHLKEMSSYELTRCEL